LKLGTVDTGQQPIRDTINGIHINKALTVTKEQAETRFVVVVVAVVVVAVVVVAIVVVAGFAVTVFVVSVFVLQILGPETPFQAGSSKGQRVYEGQFPGSLISALRKHSWKNCPPTYSASYSYEKYLHLGSFSQ